MLPLIPLYHHLSLLQWGFLDTNIADMTDQNQSSCHGERISILIKMKRFSLNKTVGDRQLRYPQLFIDYYIRVKMIQIEV